MHSKQAEYQAIEIQPNQLPPPKPPIGHWMAQNLERNGVTCKYGTVHMAYILDRWLLVLGLGGICVLCMPNQSAILSLPGLVASAHLHGDLILHLLWLWL